MQPYTHRNKI